MREVVDVVKEYCAAWSEADEATRLALLENSWIEDGIYRDPTSSAVGRKALSDHIGNIHSSSPGAVVSATSGIDEHNGQIRFTWHFVDGDGQERIKGTDFGELADDGRLAKIIGFFDPPPEL